jgi:uncharacterized repeat protein (TIGR01451 family)
MFKKLLSNLPFNPSLISQVSFYAKRMRQESAIRRTAFIFMSLAMVVQFFAIISPPQPTLAESDNDILRGGFSSREDAAAKCMSNVQDFRTILDYYGISCDALAHANPQVRLNSVALNKELDSIGRNPVAINHPKTGKPSDQYDVRIPGVSNTLHMKNLWYWDSGASSTYDALEVLSTKTGEQMWILMDCGNIVTRGHYTYNPPQPPPPPPPAPPAPPQVLSCSNLVMNVPNDSKLTLGDKVIVRGQASGKNVKAGQKVDMYYDFLDATTNKVLKSSQSPGIGFSGTTANDSQTHMFSIDEPGQYTIRLIVKYNSSTVATGSASGNCVKHISLLKPCPTAKNSQDLENCVDRRKSASNLTQKLADANGTTANPGDVIKYELTVSNTGNITVPKFTIEENISDLLDYANVVDFGGGTQNSNHVVTWPTVDIPARQIVKKTLTIKVKDTIPATPTSTSDPAHFDCYMTNVFENSITIKVACPISKTVETTTTLPSTGPGSSIAVGFAVMAIIGYFFARARLFTTELDVVRTDYAQGGM